MDAASSALPGTQVLARATSVLDAVSQGHADLGAIAAHVGTTRSTTHRLVTFLQRTGFLRHAEGRGYVLGARLVELGAVALRQMPLSAVARPHIEALARLTGDTIHVGIRDGDEIIYVDKISGSKGLEMRSRVGHRMPIASTGVGKALMLDLSEAEWRTLHAEAERRAKAAELPPPGFQPWDMYVVNMRAYAAAGHAMDIEENETAIRCVSAPVRDASGRIIAGVSIASTIPYMPRERMDDLVPVVRQCCAAISAGLGWSPRGGER